MAGVGTSTSALAVGGDPASAINELWNGTNWTEVNNVNTGRQNWAGSGPDNTAALVFGGASPPHTGKTEEWNGTNWTEVADLSTAREGLAGAGINTSGLAIGGQVPGGNQSALTEEWSGSSNTIKVLTD